VPRRGVKSGVTPSSGGRLAGIEGLRALAAGSILIVHTWGAAPGGPPGLRGFGVYFLDLRFGVTLFFTLSGFLLYRPFAVALLRDSERPSFARYLRNRALRILPAYWVILLLCAVALGSVIIRGEAGEENGSLRNPGLLARAALLVQDYQPSTLLTGIGPAWSLAVEVVFYVALPLLVLLAWKLGASATRSSHRVAAALAPAALLLVVGLVVKAVAAYVVPPPYPYAGYGTNWHSVVERSFFCQADLFAFGMALAVARALWEQGKLRLPSHWRLIALALILGSYALTARVSSTKHQLSYSPYNTLIALAFSLVLALVVLESRPSRSPFIRLLEARPFVAAGVISYSVFLWHQPLILWLRDHDLLFEGATGLFINLAIVIPLTAVLSTLTYYLVEAPAVRLKLPMLGRSERKLPSTQMQAAP
jgi:peptidoglycan/LPS O-acetylase OafA/YrhL